MPRPQALVVMRDQWTIDHVESAVETQSSEAAALPHWGDRIGGIEPTPTLSASTHISIPMPSQCHWPRSGLVWTNAVVTGIRRGSDRDRAPLTLGKGLFGSHMPAIAVVAGI